MISYYSYIEKSNLKGIFNQNEEKVLRQLSMAKLFSPNSHGGGEGVRSGKCQEYGSKWDLSTAWKHLECSRNIPS